MIHKKEYQKSRLPRHFEYYPMCAGMVVCLEKGGESCLRKG